MKNILFLFVALGFLSSCQNASDATKKAADVAGDAASKVASKAASNNADTKSMKVSPGSMVGWIGKKVTGEHKGSISVTDGTIDVANGAVTGGKFTIDMNSLICLDLEAGKGKEDLEGHLKSADFFDVAKHPTSVFEITSVAGNMVTGNLTMLGVTKSVTFPANINVDNGILKVATEMFTINRTDWGLKYGSASFFDGLKDKAINDDISLNIRLKAS